MNKTREAKIFRLLSKSIVSEDAGSVTNPHALESGQVEGTIIRLFLFGGNWLSYWLGSWLGSWLGCGLAWATVKSWGRSAIKSSWTVVSIASAIVVASIIVQILVVAIVVITLLVAIIVQVLVIT